MVDLSAETVQPALFPPTATTLTLTVGVVAETEHAQVQIEVRSATDGVLLALRSWPHIPLLVFDTRFREIGREWTRLLHEHTGPFPDRI